MVPGSMSTRSEAGRVEDAGVAEVGDRHANLWVIVPMPSAWETRVSPGAEEAGRIHPVADARRRTGEDQVAGQQRADRRQAGDQVGDREDHV